MNLEKLHARKVEIEQAMVSMGDKYQDLLDDKDEVEYQIAELMKPVEPEVPVEPPVETQVEPVVE